MSFILDALKKSETERQRADAPALYEVKLAPPRRGVAIWLIVLAALLVINVIVLSVVLLRGTHGTAQMEAATTASPAPPPPSVPSPPAAAPSAPAMAAPANPPAALPPVAAGSENASTTGSGSADAADDAPAVEPPHAAGTATGTAAGDVPSYAQAASAPGANLPELKLDLHAYAPNPADRFVFLNMIKLREGQSTPGGVRVESITPDGAVLSWQGSRFFLQRQ